MEPTDLTLKILQGIRDDLRASTEAQRATTEAHRASTEAQTAFQREVLKRFELSDKRSAAMEAAIRDMAEKIAILARGVKVGISNRAFLLSHIEDHEKRLRALEETRSS
jgi:hypothetical protein